MIAAPFAAGLRQAPLSEDQVRGEEPRSSAPLRHQAGGRDTNARECFLPVQFAARSSGGSGTGGTGLGLMVGFRMKTVLLLICSNIFMTIAWYGHLKYRRAPLITVIVLSWMIAFLEYCFQVPANRLGYGQFTGFQ